MTKHKDKMYVAAIKIGTSVSGLSYSLATEYQWRNVVTETWNCETANANTVSQTIPSVLLITPDLKSCSYGYEAEDKYASMLEDIANDKDEYFYFSSMSFLWTDKEIQNVEEENKRTISVSVVLRHILSFFMDYIMSRLKGSHMAREITVEDLGVVFVIPKWSGYLSSKLEEIAEEINVHKLVVVSEPEATLQYYRLNDKSPEYAQNLKSNEVFILNIEETFIQLSEVKTSNPKDNHRIENFTEYLENRDNPFETFKLFLGGIFGKETVQKFCKRYMMDLLELKRTFEMMIRKQGKNKLYLPSSLCELVSELTGKTVQEKVQEYGDIRNVKIQRHSLILGQSVIKGFLKPIQKTTFSILKSNLEKRRMNTVFVIGQLPSVHGDILVEVSKFLKLNSVEMIGLKSPDDADLTSLKGAVYFGHDPWIRILRRRRSSEGKENADWRKCTDYLDLVTKDVQTSSIISSSALLLSLNIFAHNVVLDTQNSHAKAERDLNVSIINYLQNKTQFPSTGKPTLIGSLCRHYFFTSSNKEFQKKLLKLGIRSIIEWYVRIAFKFHKEEFVDSVDILDAFRKSERDTGMSKVIFEEIRKHFCSVNDTSNIVRIWPGYKSQEGLTIHRFDSLVVITKGDIKKQKYFLGFNLHFRDVKEVNNEAATVISKEDSPVCEVQITDRDVDKLFRLHSNITLISSSNITSSGFNSGLHSMERQPCIVMYCHLKGIIPMGETEFPRKINNCHVDVREAVCFFTAGQNCLQMGNAIGVKNENGFGTLGGFVKFDDPASGHKGLKGFLTCAHVVFPLNILKTSNVRTYATNNRIEIVDKSSPEDTIGVVKRAVFRHSDTSQTSVDAALVEIHNRYPEDGTFWNERITTEHLISAGFSEYQILEFERGETVKCDSSNVNNQIIKVGANTGLTKGYVHCKSVHAAIINDEPVAHGSENNGMTFKVHGQLEILPLRRRGNNTADTNFLTHGDSGSFVFMLDQGMQLKCTGLAIAVTSYGSCLTTPIENVLRDLGLRLDSLMSFQSDSNANTQNSQTPHPDFHQAFQIFRTEMFTKMEEMISSQGRMQTDLTKTKQDVEEIISSQERLESTTASLRSDLIKTNKDVEEIISSHRRLETTTASLQTNLTKTNKDMSKLSERLDSLEVSNSENTNFIQSYAQPKTRSNSL